MRRLFRLLLLLLILAGVITAALILLPFPTPRLEQPNLPLFNAPDSTSGTQAEPPITTSDGCVAAASSVDARTQQQRRPTDTLPNGRPFPGVGPRRVNVPNRPAQNQVLIQFTSASSQQERNAYIRSLNGRARRRIDGLNSFAVTLPPNQSTSDLPASPVVVRVELDYIAGATQGETTPNDPRFGEQWSLPVIGLPAAWSGLPSNASPITVAVIDSGICLNHPDLSGRIIGGFDFVDDDESPQDIFGHGCGVAGVIAATLNNSLGIAGVAPNARLMPLRVLDASGLGNYSDISAAIVYAADNGAQIINLSLAGPQFSQIMADAVAYATARGVTVIAAAGNSGIEGAGYPAAFPAVIAVGSVDPDLQRSDFSNYGANVDIFAPGRDILTTSITGDYEVMTGTSFAAPHVAGIAALAQTYGTPLNMENDVVLLYPPDNQLSCS